MAQVFLIMLRTDIPDGVLQVVDLWPNTSSKNYVIDPGLGQTGYLHNIPAPSIAAGVAAGPPLVATADLTGVAAYLIGHIDTTGVGSSAVFSGAEADTAAAALVAIAQAGTVLDTAAVNGVLGAVVGGTTISGGGSTGVLSELLSVIAGNVYRITAGAVLSDGGGDFAGTVGAFVTGTYAQLYNIGPFLASNLNGNVSLLKDASFTYDNALGVPTTGAAVTVYAEDGALFV
jgi:hypothetical protein